MIALKLPFRRIPFDRWPASDQLAFKLAVRTTSPLDDPGPLANLSPTTIDTIKRAYGLWLAYLASNSPAEIDGSGLTQLTPDNLRTYVVELQKCLGTHSVSSYIFRLLGAARALNPLGNFDFVKITATNLLRRAKPVTDRRQLLVPARDLYRLGLNLMAKAAKADGPRQAAVLYRDGLIIAFLASCPVRLGNLASIKIDHHLVRTDTGYVVVFPAEEVKNRRHIEFAWPEALTAHLEHYLHVHRAYLAALTGPRYRGPHQGLWVSLHGSKLHRGGVGLIIHDRTKEKFGRAIFPHLFRHAAATSIAIEDPAHVRSATAILGHSSSKTTEAHYNLATSLEAAREFQRVLLEQRHDHRHQRQQRR